MLVEMGLERAPTGWYQDARSTPARCCPAGEMHPSPGPPDRRSRSGMCSMVRTAGGVDCPWFRLWWSGTGMYHKGPPDCTAHTAHMPYEAFSHFPFSSLFLTPTFLPNKRPTPSHFGPSPQGQMRFTGRESLEIVLTWSCRHRYKTSQFLDAQSHTLLNSGFVKASRKLLIYFFFPHLQTSHCWATSL